LVFCSGGPTACSGLLLARAEELDVEVGSDENIGSVKEQRSGIKLGASDLCSREYVSGSWIGEASRNDARGWEV